VIAGGMVMKAGPAMAAPNAITKPIIPANRFTDKGNSDWSFVNLKSYKASGK
jgi:hypothetical protein